MLTDLPRQEIHLVPTPLGPIACRIDGAGPGVPLLLTQRFRGTMDDWDPAFIARLAEGRSVIRFDNLGIGRTGGKVPATIPEMAEVALAFARALGLRQFDLLGWSLGGTVALEATLAAPDLVRRLIIAGSSFGPDPEGPQMDPRVPAKMARGTNDAGDFLFLFYAVDGIGRTLGQASIDRIAAVEPKGPPTTTEGFMAQMQAIARWPGVRPRLGELALPMLVANGNADVMIPTHRSWILSQEAPNAKLVIYPKSGHGFLFQYLDDFTAEVNRFLA